VPKFLIYIVGTIGTIGRDLALLEFGWHVRFFADETITDYLSYILIEVICYERTRDQGTLGSIAAQL
jgi:hypothetical protein